MINAWKRLAISAVAASIGVGASAQIPDLLSAFEMGGRAFGMGGALYSNASDVSASYWNPAGLAYIDSAQGQLNFRNRPSTNTILSGTFSEEERDGTSKFGSNGITFAGFAFPFKNGVLGVSYAVGGYAREEASGTITSGDPKDPTTWDPKTEFLKVMNEFVTVGWGTASTGGTNVGVGVVFARQSVEDRLFIRLVRDGQVIGTEEADNSEAGTGVGGIFGIQFTPPGNQNVSFGVSYRTEIALEGLGQYSDTLPARLQGGVIWRVDGLRGGQDYLVGGVDVAYFFESSAGKILSRDNQLSAGFGFEYNRADSRGYISIRTGFRTTERAADGFEGRDVITFGLGFRPKIGDYRIDLNMAAPSGQSNPDFSISMSFLMGK